ncbi:hypothetical protein PPERSA_04694 [Pseudocohnilembus persalinus]|uniref:Uncharacterized protein n=1 Tax=Pseudocohnilembus persalinus TaxID=266149 RepID=A0A0V0R4H6_PSEPJ|nr:hypothetical protein PPERSA_04694 [Pseudocohnilembus persalinus]|eukprot:KRX09388.1 hypothetical protein PPERSA_04694 [Pseudocohnilembus persalinus]
MSYNPANNQTSTDNPLKTTSWANYSHRDMKQQIGVSSLKILDGEDLSYGNRKRLQQLQQKDWIDQQVQEKRERQEYLKETHQAYDGQRTHINDMAISLENAEKEKRKYLQKTCQEYNKQQAFEKFDKARNQHKIEQEDNQNHISYCTTNNFQTENTNTCKSALSENRYIPYHWKGMNPQEKKKIKEEQEKQIEERRMLEQQEKEENKLYSIQDEHQRFQNINLQIANERNHKKKLDEIKEYNLLAAKEQKLKLKTMYD